MLDSTELLGMSFSQPPIKMGSLTTSSKDDPAIADLIASLKSSLYEYESTGSNNRARLKNVAERLCLALESPGDTAQRIAYYVSLSHPLLVMSI